MKKNTNTIYGIVIIVVFVLGMILLASPKGKESASLPDSLLGGDSSVSLSEDGFDFGVIKMSAGKVSRLFSVKNDGTEPLVIEKLYTSCMCTNAEISLGGKKYGPFGMAGHGFLPSINAKLMPGESAEVNVVFDPAAHGPAGVGRIERLVYLENNLGAPITLKIAATVTP